MGWKPLAFHIDFLRLMFMWRILLLPMSNIYKTILIRRFLHKVYHYTGSRCGPAKNMLDICIKYGLQNFVLYAIENADYCSMRQWKRMVKYVIEERCLDK